MKVTNIDRTLAKRIGDEALTVLKAVASQYGLTVEIRGGKFSPGTFEPRVKFAVQGDTLANGVTVTKDAQETWAKYAAIFNLKPEWFGKSYERGGHKFTVIGLRTSARKNCVLLHDATTGREYTTSADMLAHVFK